MSNLIILLLGGGIGTISRYYLSTFMERFVTSSFPLGTITVNMIGCFIIGIFWGLFTSLNMSHSLRLFLFVGLCGGFTTFASFALENQYLINNNKLGLFFANILISNIVGILFVIVGIKLGKFIFS